MSLGDALTQIETLIATGEEVLRLRDQACRTWWGRLCWRVGYRGVTHLGRVAELEGGLNELIARARDPWLRARLLRLRDVNLALEAPQPLWRRR